MNVDSTLPADTSLASLMVAQAWGQPARPRLTPITGPDAERRQAIVERINTIEAEMSASFWRSFK